MSSKMSHADEPCAKRCKESIKSELQKISSYHILQLNNDCLLTIFEYLNIESLCHIANVCTRFKGASEELFSYKYKSFEFKNSNIKLPLLRRVLCKFGHYIQSLRVECLETISNLQLAKYCSINLKHLSLRSVKITHDEIVPLVPHLECLEIRFCQMDAHGDWNKVFNNAPELEKLVFKMKNGHSKWADNMLMRHMPKLKHIELDCCDLHSDQLSGILRLNPQLKQLIITTFINDEFIEAIVENVKDLEELTFGSKEAKQTGHHSAKGLLRLSELKNLTKLGINDFRWVGYEDSLSLLVKTFINKNILLEELSIESRSFDLTVVDDLVNMKTLRKLRLGGFDITATDLIALTAELPLLSKLTISYNFNGTINVGTLITMIEIRKELDYLSFDGDCYFIITEQDYNSLVQAVLNTGMNRKVKIQVENNDKFDLRVHESTLLANKNHLELESKNSKYFDVYSLTVPEDIIKLLKPLST
ncbi:uncharacterized protein LOC116339353 [Contarinia nasturtii]|uniref:uncharacterized protein LOC116339353 n=1 Tax=Contarinia nasturtii TaxID=265458 RepID=UPI0012D4598D|nr:uncharacterized protein LOC116339353 [Contarinia nasturtii]